MSTSTQQRADERLAPGDDVPTPPPPPPDRPVGLGPIGWARWVWRQLTSMRTALMLLLLLAVGAVPGSIFPQTSIDPVKVAQYRADHHVLAPWLSRLGGFDVYGSPWFAAIYLLLFISLVGCVLPRTRVHLRNLREAPPRTPSNLARLPEHRRAEVAADPEQVLVAARAVLRRRRYRTGDHPGSVAAQRGELRETGNLVFHLALLGVLVSFAVSRLFGYSGQVVVPVGDAFVDSLTNIDTITTGAAVDTDDLPPFRFTLRDVHVRFDDSDAGNQFGAPRKFSADVRVVDRPGAAAHAATIAVNHPLDVSGVKVYLAGNGYAPVITVRDAAGKAVFHEAVPFLVQDSNYTSTGVVKVTGASPQIGLSGKFLPTAVVSRTLGPISSFPDDRRPRFVFAAWTGDLGVDGGVPQNVYVLDTTHMQQLRTAAGQPFSVSLAPGQTAQLPDGRGSVTLDRVDRYAGFTFRHDPSRDEALVFALLAIAGLTLSLFVPRRRVWVRAVAGADGATRVEVAALARSEDVGLAAEADAVLAAVVAQLPDPGGRGPAGGPRTDHPDHPDQRPEERPEDAGSTS